MQWLTDFFAPLFQWTMPRPQAYGDWATSWFHYVTFALIIVLAIVFARYYQHQPAAKTYRFVFIVALLMALFEGLRQIFFVWQSGGGYPWYVFPFQFCSTPIYAGLLVRFVKPAMKEILMLYLGSFSLLGGLLVMLLPNDIYIDSVYINFQTTFHHGAMLVIGLLALVRLKNITLKQFIPSIVTFSIFIAVAVVMNTAHNILINVPTFNMFFINPQYGTSLPVLIDIYPVVPYPVFLLIYVIGFTFGAYSLIAIKHAVVGIQSHQLKLAK